MKKNILQLVDTYSWAIGTLAKAIVEYNPHYNWRMIDVHPKSIERGELTPKKIEELKEALEWCDIVEAEYWRTLSQLSDMFPQLKEKKVILTHHNEKNLLSENWDYVDMHIAKTKYSEEKLRQVYGEKVTYIPNSYDPDVFQYNTEYPKGNEKPTVGYVGRITRWKGLKGVLKACTELGYTLLIMGKEDDRTYWNEIPEEHKACIDWSYFNCPASDVPKFYKEIDVYVGNSGSGREVGTLGFIEALASGVPVVTTPSGLANDIGEDQENMVVVDFDDEEGLKRGLQQVVENKNFAERIRKKGWDTIRGYNHERMAWQYRKVFNKFLYVSEIVSVIIPATYTREMDVKKILDNLEKQTYNNIEAVVVWDEVETKKLEIIIDDYSFPIKWCITGRDGYNLAMARNIGAIEADGNFLMFCDSRLCPQFDAVANFLEALLKGDNKKIWIFGNKGFEKLTFVENFSMVRRDHFIRAGMMNERITGYGGLSQELRDRFMSQGFELKYEPSAKAEELRKGTKNTERYSQIIKMKNLLYKMYE